MYQNRFRNYNTYGLKALTAPTNLPVSLASLRDQVEVLDTDGHDDKLTIYLKAAAKWVQEQTETSLINTSWQWTIDRFPRKREWLILPRWPVVSLDEIRYVDLDASSQVMNLSTVSLRASDGRARLSMVDYAAWPSTRVTPDAIKIKFTAGYGTSSASVPAEWQQPILLLAAHWFKVREAVIDGPGVEVPFGVQSLIDMLRDPDDNEDFDTE